MDLHTTVAVPQQGCSETTACLVCGRASNTGHHYGVVACLGCKTFFRRVVLQGSSPKCKFNNNCEIAKIGNAKRICRSCRYWKCIEIGMKEEALHPCRDIIGRRRRVSESPPSLFPMEQKPTSVDLQLLLDIREMDAEIRSRTALLLGEPVRGPQNHFYSPTCDYSNVSVSSELGRSIKVDVQLLPEWVRRVPFFEQLSVQFQKHLLQRFCLRYTVIEHGVYTAQMPPHEHVWFLSDRSCLIRDIVDIPQEIRRLLTPSVIEEQKLLSGFTSMLIDEVANPLRQLTLTTTEVAALKVLMLLKPTQLQEPTTGEDIASQADRELVGQVRDRVLRGLHEYYDVEGNDVVCRLADVLTLLGGIEMCADRAREEMYLLRIFDLSSFDSSASELIFGKSMSETC